MFYVIVFVTFSKYLNFTKNNNYVCINMLHSTLKLISIGGQYLDGTTDVTRTFHYGTPKPFEIEVDMSTVVEYSQLGILGN